MCARWQRVDHDDDDDDGRDDAAATDDDDEICPNSIRALV